MTFNYFEPHANLSNVLARPELQNRKVINVQLVTIYDENDLPIRERIDVTVERGLIDQQIIEPTNSERLEAAELMIDLLLDTQEAI